jgi:hypothetical protein
MPFRVRLPEGSRELVVGSDQIGEDYVPTDTG